MFGWSRLKPGYRIFSIVMILLIISTSAYSVYMLLSFTNCNKWADDNKSQITAEAYDALKVYSSDKLCNIGILNSLKNTSATTFNMETTTPNNLLWYSLIIIPILFFVIVSFIWGSKKFLGENTTN